MTPRPFVERAANFDDMETGPSLVFYRAKGEGIRYPDDVVSLLKTQGVQTGRLTARNPITHDQWWIPVTALAAAGAPYAKALASVIRAWLKARKGRQVRLENGRTKITANTSADAERLLVALTRHEKEIAALHITKAGKKQVKKATSRRTKKR